MTTKEKIEVMQAYLDGKQIQITNRGGKDWGAVVTNPVWDWQVFDYRIKPKEEPVRMTNRQLAEWVGKGNGEWLAIMGVHSDFGYVKGKEDLEVSSDFLIRPWGSDEWIEPTVDIYERDCKGN